MLTHPSYNKAVTAHKDSNRIIVVYAALNAATFLLAVPESQNYFIIPIPYCVLLELSCRFVLLHLMEIPEKILHQISGCFNILMVVINPPFITVNTLRGGESEEPFPDIELED